MRPFKGATKLYFMHRSCVVILLFNTVSYKSAFPTYSFRKRIILLEKTCFQRGFEFLKNISHINKKVEHQKSKVVQII